MYYGTAVLMGIWVALMLAVNGWLAEVYGAYPATVLIHVVGLAAVLILATVRRQWRRPAGRLPFYCFLGGAVGVVTTAGGNLAFGAISMSAMMALGLLGQTVTAAVVDQFGLLGMAKRPLRPAKLVGVAVIAAGIAVMLVWG